MKRVVACVLAGLIFGVSGSSASGGDDPGTAPKPVYKRNDMNRPRPAVIDPGQAGGPDRPGRAPSDAVVLFDRADLSAWDQLRGRDPKATAWAVHDDHFECRPRSGSLVTKQAFGDSQIHIEWWSSPEAKGKGQGRGNSGLKLGNFGEVQILDSYRNDTYPDGQAAALYGKYPPLVNASRAPGPWQTLDILAEHERKDEDGRVVRPARLTVLHNGILCHHAVEMDTKGQKEFKLTLQDHGEPIRFRNVWVRPLKGYDVEGTPAVSSNP